MKNTESHHILSIASLRNPSILVSHFYEKISRKISPLQVLFHYLIMILDIFSIFINTFLMVRFLPEKKDFRNWHNSDESISLQHFKDLPLLLIILIRLETIYESSMLHKTFNNDGNPKRSMNFFILINIYMENSVDDRLQSLLSMQNFHRIKNSYKN